MLELLEDIAQHRISELCRVFDSEELKHLFGMRRRGVAPEDGQSFDALNGLCLGSRC